jgi:membrane protein YqaA with SNARE-associated domain
VKNQKKGKDKPLRFGLIEILAMAVFSIIILIYSEQLAEFLGQWSLPGLFVLSFLGSASVIAPAAALQAAIISLIAGIENHILAAVVAGVGSGIGEISGYIVGQGSEKILKTKDKTARYILKLQKDFLKKHALVGIFVLSVIPNPFFDIAGIMAGMMKVKVDQFLILSIAGRIVRYVVIGHLGLHAISLL